MAAQVGQSNHKKGPTIDGRNECNIDFCRSAIMAHREPHECEVRSPVMSSSTKSDEVAFLSLPNQVVLIWRLELRLSL